MELIAFGVSAEVVMIIEDEDAGILVGGLAEKVGSGKTTDASADDDQIESLSGGFGVAGMIPEGTIAQTVCGLE